MVRAAIMFSGLAVVLRLVYPDADWEQMSKIALIPGAAVLGFVMLRDRADNT